MATFLVINGPNLDRLGTREPAQYGRESLESLNGRLVEQARERGHSLETFQSNAEHALIERIHRAGDDGIDGLILNPAGFTHTSVALRDAVLAADVPMIEVHLSNPAAREAFRHHSYFSDIAIGTISGLGPDGYLYALQALDARFR